MSKFRILLISNRTPRSTWNLACRLEQEVPGAQICGIVIQKSPKKNEWRRALRDRILDIVLSIVHAYPAKWKGNSEFGMDELSKECERKGWRIFAADKLDAAAVQEFVRSQNAHLGLLAGAPEVDSATQALPRNGSLAIEVSFSNGSASSSAVPSPDEGPCVKIDPAFDSTAVLRRISVRFPSHPYDTAEGMKLKSDLISDDLAVRAIESLSTENPAGADESVAAWAASLPGFTADSRANQFHISLDPPLWRISSTWKLCIHTLVLLSPLVVVRNWYRRLRGQFPVLILFHHLVSDRPHRMGIPTEFFFREVEFLQRYYRVVSVSEAAKILKSGSVKAPTVVLTFDDGYEDNFLSLRAITEASGVPVSLYVSTDAVDNHAEFQHDLRIGTTGFRALNWDQIRYWQNDRVEFGSHTRTHFNCGSTDRHALEQEIVGSGDDMENRLGTPPRFFAFPWGKLRNMSAPAVEIATSRYEYCFSTLPAENFANGGTAHKVVGRKGLPATVWELELTLQSVFDYARRLRRSARGSEDEVSRSTS